MTWDPDQYQRYADHRSRPFLDLISQIEVTDPRRVVDLGCGTGGLTAILARRWPDAEVIGIDSSPDMVGRAPTGPGAPRIELGDIADFDASGTDVLVSNAALQLVPGHRDLLRRWVAQLSVGGTIAIQVPGNFGAPSHVLMRQLAVSPRWSAALAGVLRPEAPVVEPADYAATLLDAGLQANVWETTYMQMLAGLDAVLQWMRGTGLRPVLDALSATSGEEFSSQYGAVLRTAYPAGPHGTEFPFRRIFCVGHRLPLSGTARQ